MKLNNMVALLASSVGARLAGAGLGLLTQIAIARSFAQGDVGIIFLTMSMAAIMSLIVTAGYPMLALTELPKLYQRGHKSVIAMFHSLALVDWMILSAAIFTCSIAALLFLPVSSGMRLAIIFGLLSSPVSATIRFLSAIANSHKLYAITLVPDNIVRPGLFLLVIGAAYLFGFKLPLVTVLIAYVASNAVTAIVQLPFLAKKLPRSKDFIRPRKKFASIVRRRSFAIAVVAAVATMFADVVTLLGGMILPPEDVGILGVTIRLAAIAGFFIQSTQQLVLPDLTVAIACHDQSKSDQILLRLNILTMAVIVAALLGTIVLGPFALRIFGPQYEQGEGLLILFMIGQAVRAFSGMNQQVLSIAGQQVRTVWACLVAVIFLVSSWILFGKIWGLLGIGYAVIGAELVWCLMLAVQAQTLTGRRADLLWILTHSQTRKKRDGLSS
jgi:O-antigen/teichoic acid export membrane protein